MSDNIVIVGASHAAAQACVSLRQLGWQGGLHLVSDEACLPYHRPPLSKSFMSGEDTLDDILIRPASAYEELDVTLYLGTRATRIDRTAGIVVLDRGGPLPYSKLILATGARVRRLDLPGAASAKDGDGVFYLRDRADALSIREAVRGGARSALIIGGGYIGLEVAASLRKLGLDVRVLEAQDRILQRVTTPEMSAFYRRVHTEEGVAIVEGATARSIARQSGEKGEGLRVATTAGDFEADMVVVGIGVIPNVELAAAAGLEIGDPARGESGIRVDAFGRTSDPDIYAIGDVAWHHNDLYERHMRVESVPNATHMAKVASAHILRPAAAPPRAALPWFWSDQYDLKLQIAGLSQGADRAVVRGDMLSGRSVAVFHFKDERLVAVDAVNAPRAFMFAKLAIPKGMALDPVKLADPATDLKACII